MFPQLKPEDREALRYVGITMRDYQVIDRARLIPQVLKQFQEGLATYAEARAMLGMSHEDFEAVIAQWGRDKQLLAEAGPKMPKPTEDGGEEDDKDGGK